MSKNNVVAIQLEFIEVYGMLPEEVSKLLSTQFDAFGRAFEHAKNAEDREGSVEFKNSDVNSVEHKEKMLEVLYGIISVVKGAELVDSNDIVKLEEIKDSLIKSIEKSQGVSGSHQTKWQDLLEASLNENTMKPKQR
jgi:hypothetical protein